MSRSIALIGTLDTKGDQIAYLKARIENRGHHALVMDVGVLGEAPFETEITRGEIAQAAGTTLREIIAFDNEAEALDKMKDGACNVVRALHSSGKLKGIVAVGGSMGTALALQVMQALPLGLPKLIISTMAYSHAINPDLLSTDLIMVPWIGGLWGINEVSRRVLEQAAGIILGAAEAYEPKPIEKKLIGVTSTGMTSARYLYHLRPALEKRNYEVAVFHATGMSTRLLEKAIAEGWVDAVLELQAGKELINEVCGSVFSSGAHRLEAAAERGIPQILSLGTIELFWWTSYQPLPPKFADRRIFQHNPLLWMISSSVEEKVAAAKLMVDKLNRAKGPAAVIIPLKPSLGLTKLGAQDPKGLEALRKELRTNLKPAVKLVELEASPDDLEFALEVVNLLDEMMEQTL
jgi:uncharacterized protein (UPF0261 family)